MSEITQVQSEARPCPVCDVLSEPEQDGEYIYFECTNEECDTPGYQWGFEKVEGTSIVGNCQLGIPESVRRAASAPMEQAIADEVKRQPIDISIGRRPE